MFTWSFTTSGEALTARVNCWPIVPGTLTITASDGVETKTFTDDGDGNLIGDGSGTVDYGWGILNIIFSLPVLASGTEIFATYESREGGCYNSCGRCATQKLRLNIVPASISGQGDIVIGEAWNRLMKKIRRDVLPAHVELINEVFEESYIWQIGHRFDIIKSDEEQLDMSGLHSIFDSDEW